MYTHIESEGYRLRLIVKVHLHPSGALEVHRSLLWCCWPLKKVLNTPPSKIYKYTSTHSRSHAVIVQCSPGGQLWGMEVCRGAVPSSSTQGSCCLQ